MTRVARVRCAAALASAGLLLGACAHGHPASDPAVTPSSTRPSSAPPGTVTSGPLSTRPSHHEVSAAVTAVRRWLNAWVDQGPAGASRYLVVDQRTTNGPGAPRIEAGAVRSYRLYRWQGPHDFTLLVSLDLTFRNNPMAWSRGSNDRFVTAHWAGSRDGYLLELATGP